MRGDETVIALLISLTIVLILVASAAAISGKSFGDGGVYDKYSKPLFYGESVTKVGAKKYLDKNNALLKEVTAIFSPNGNPLGPMCSRWYNDCGGTSSPWNNKPCYEESDFDEGVSYLCRDSRSSDVRSQIASAWSSKADFKSLNEDEQYNLMRNACELDLLDRIYSSSDWCSGQ
ncbi:MAG: hypothetical protein JW727_04300 [Candidatus Aenigmarchaeota archaeon]|nr:hypothetical protein [Candidatus Aenigmarchaeota archaeon]